MSAIIDEDGVSPQRPGLADAFEGRPPSDRQDLWRRTLFTLGALVVFRIGAQLPVPGLDALALREFFAERSGTIGLLDMAGGSAIGYISIFALGIMPYISALIIVHLASRIIPQLGRSPAGGRRWRVRLNQFARIVTVVLAAFQAFGVATALRGAPGLVGISSPLFEATTVVTMAAGALYLTWLAEQISERGLGDGALVILAFGAAGSLPRALRVHMEMYGSGALEGLWVLASPAMTVIFLALVVFVEQAERRNPIRDPARRSRDSDTGGGDGRTSRRLNPAGVVPALAAGIFIAPLWQSIASIGGAETAPAGYFIGMGYLLLYSVLIVFFAAFFNFAILVPDAATQKPGSGEMIGYLQRTLPIVFVVAYVALVCVVPLLFYRWKNLPFVLAGFQIFLLGWVMTRILERARPSWQS